MSHDGQRSRSARRDLAADARSRRSSAARRRTRASSTRALARVGELEYRVFVPVDRAGRRRRAADHGRRRSTGRARSTAGPDRGDGAAALAPGRVRRALRLDDARRDPLPAQRDAPAASTRPPAATTVHDLQHELFPQFFSRAELAYRRRRLRLDGRRASRIVITISEHARDDADRALRARPGARAARSTSASTTSASRPDDRAARAVPALPGEPLAAQEPRAALRGVRARAARAAGAPARADGRRPRARRCRTGVEIARARLATTSSSTSTARAVGARLSEPLRGLRPAAARGDGVRLPGRRVARDVAAGGLRRRGRATSTRSRRRTWPAAIEAVLADPGAVRRARSRPARPFSWEATARAHEDVYRRLAAEE